MDIFSKKGKIVTTLCGQNPHKYNLTTKNLDNFHKKQQENNYKIYIQIVDETTTFNS